MPKRKTYILFIIAVISVLITLGILFIMFNALKAKNEKTSTLLQSLNRRISQEDNIETLQKTIADTNEKRSLVSSYIVDKGQINKFVEWIENEGDVVGVPVTVSNVALNSAKKDLLSVSFEASGEFDKIMKLVSVIEYAPYQIHIKNVYLNKIINTTSTTEKEQPVTGWQVKVDIDVISIEIKK